MARMRTWGAIAAGALLCLAGAARARDVQSRLELMAYPPPPTSFGCVDGRARLAHADPLPTIWLATTDDSPVIAGRLVRTAPPRVDVSFDITPEGRPHALRETGPGAPFANDGPDIDAIIVGTWRFTPGRAFSGCRLEAVARFIHVEDATRGMLLAVVGEAPRASSYDATRSGAPLMTSSGPPMTAFERDVAAFHRILTAPGSTCASAGPLHPLVKATPDTASLDETPGDQAWALIDYDIAADGRTANAALAGSSGDAAYDARALAAMQRSMFSGGARSGCLAVFRHAGPPLPWPKEPPLKLPDSCPVQPAMSAADVGRFYPDAYQQRKIEGWALVRFDVAATGDVSDVRVVRAEPAVAFGEAARSVIMGSKLTTNPRGESGCLVAVAFKFPMTGLAAQPAPPH